MAAVSGACMDVRAPERSPSPLLGRSVPRSRTTAHHLLKPTSEPTCYPPGGAAVTAHPVDEKLPALKMATTGLQHVAAMYAGVVAPPLIVGAAVGLSPTELTFLTGACLFTAGLAT